MSFKYSVNYILQIFIINFNHIENFIFSKILGTKGFVKRKLELN